MRGRLALREDGSIVTCPPNESSEALMDAFAITGISPDEQWFRVEGAVGGEDGPARLYPRVHVMDSGEIAELASAGRRLYFAQPQAEAPLVPLVPDDALDFDAMQLPIEELPRFAFLEHASDEDVDALLAIRMGQELGPVARRLSRLESLGWVESDGDADPALTPLGVELLRHWLS
jgi:hypothetical protein